MRISRNWIVAAGWVGLALATSSTVQAQERVEPPSYLSERVRAPRDAFELGVTAGYSQGTMAPAAGYGTTDLTKAGGAFGLQVGYRFTPQFALHVFGEFNEFVPGNTLSTNAETRGGVAGINGTFHLLPYNRVDPWVRLGVGYRSLWVTGDPNVPDTQWHGFQLAKLEIGADLRTDENVAIGPMIGADLTEFVWQNPAGDAGNQEIADKRIIPFVYAGLQGRFDLGGLRERRGETLGASR
jgi:hypothetical protein